MSVGPKAALAPLISLHTSRPLFSIESELHWPEMLFIAATIASSTLPNDGLRLIQPASFLSSLDCAKLMFLFFKFFIFRVINVMCGAKTEIVGRMVILKSPKGACLV